MEGHNENVALFYRPKENPTVKNTEWVEYRPTGQLTEGSTLDFIVAGSSTRYVDLARTRIRVQVRIVQGNGQKLPKPIVEGKPTPAAAKVGPVNLLLQSMFKQVDVSFQQQVISPHVSTKYPYKAYMETLLNFGEAASLSKLQSQLFYKDQGDPSNNDPVDGSNPGLIERSVYTEESKVVTLEGPLYVDIMEQSRYILPGVEMGFKLWPSSHEFVLMSSNPAADYKLEIVEAVLKVNMVELTSDMLLAHAQALKTSPASYFYERSDMKAFGVAKGRFGCSIEDPYQGFVPSQLLVGLVSSEAYMGNYKRNPLEFKTFDCNSIAFYVNGHSTPTAPIRPNYKDGDYLTGYMSLLGENYNEDKGILISREDYAKGYCLYKFDTCKDYCKKYTRNVTKGHTRIDIAFSKELPEACTVILFSKFPGQLDINEARSVQIAHFE